MKQGTADHNRNKLVKMGFMTFLRYDIYNTQIHNIFPFILAVTLGRVNVEQVWMLMFHLNARCILWTKYNSKIQSKIDF